jgi:PAS domain S-box-containing protein/putative nucleotidyltransferase with HDIG domain
MKNELRVLMVEDEPTDAELIEHKLRKEGIKFISQRVQSQAGLIKALKEFCPDIILSDYNLPDLNGMDVLNIVRHDYSNVPVVMVTGALSDIEAVELIHAGARDYVLKDRLARLAPAVQRALTAEEVERARKEAEKALLESEAKFRSLVESTSDWIWEVDENGNYTYSSPQVYDLLGYRADEVIGRSALHYMVPDDAKKYQEQISSIAAQCKHFHLLENANLHKDGRVVYLEASGAPMLDSQGKLIGYRGINRDITERKEVEKERRANAKKLEKTLLQTIEAIAATLEARDPYTAGHQRQVAALVRAIATEMGLSELKISGLYLAALIHDLGKISVPAEILNKPGKLNPIELELIKEHAQTGYDILKDIMFPSPIAEMVLQHHERLDGSGYPQHLKDGQILLESKMLAVADVVEAMTFYRPYRPGLGLEAALQEITDNRGILYDAQVVDTCIALFREKRFSFERM